MPRTPQSGDLRHQVTWRFVDPSQTDICNETTGATIERGTFRAMIEPLGGMELYNARQLKPETSHGIWMRNVGPIAAGHQLVFEGTGRVFNVDSVYRHQERNMWLRIHATEELTSNQMGPADGG